MPTATREAPGDRQFLISTLPPGRGQTRLAAGVLLVLLATLAATLPYGRIPLAGTEILLPAYATAILMNEVITSSLLFALYAIQGSRALLVLAAGYLFTALLVIPWALSFPGVFAPDGLLGSGLQGTASVAALRRLGLPLVMLAYALLKDREPERPVRPALWAVVTAVVAGAGAVGWFCMTQDDRLPRLMVSGSQISDLWPYVIHAATLLCLAALAILWRRRRSVLDLWLMVALCAWLIETALLGYGSGGRFSAGWWAGRVYGLVSASVVLLVLLSETTTLYARLARSVAAERRARGERLTGMEVLSASIAHEVNQPLASMVSNADAGLRWLDRREPDLEEARAAFRRIVGDGHRAGRMIKCIREVFRRRVQEPVALDIAGLVHEALRHTRAETRLGGVSVQTELARSLPAAVGNPVQIQQLLVNLITNAVDALLPVTDRARVLRIRSERGESGEILVTVEDTGTGLDPERKERLFEPFFTTKPDGMGMGLMICRSIVEAHGGRLWLTDNAPHGAPHGAVVRFTLPPARVNHTPV